MEAWNRSRADAAARRVRSATAVTVGGSLLGVGTLLVLMPPHASAVPAADTTPVLPATVVDASPTPTPGHPSAGPARAHVLPATAPSVVTASAPSASVPTSLRPTAAITTTRAAASTRPSTVTSTAARQASPQTSAATAARPAATRTAAPAPTAAPTTAPAPQRTAGPTPSPRPVATSGSS